MLTQPWVFVNQPLPENSTWGKMQTQFESFPNFVAPNNAGQLQNLYSKGDFWPNTTRGYPSKIVNTLGNSKVGACVNGTGTKVNWWGCLTTDDEAGSYVSINTNTTRPRAFLTNVSSPSSNGNNLVLSVTATVQCRQTWGPVLPLNVSLIIANGTGIAVLFPISPDSSCPINDWGMISYTWDLSGDNDVVSRFVNAALAVQAEQTNQSIDVSYIRVQMVPSNTQLCGTGLDGIGCNLGNFAWTVVNFFVTLGTGAVFLFQVLFWFVSMIGIFFSSLLGLFGANGAPPIIAGVVGIVIIGLVFYVAIVGMGKIRGTGNVG